MKRVILSFIATIITVVGFTTTASAGTLYAGTSATTNNDGCYGYSLETGYKIAKGVGPQFRATNFSGDAKCDVKDSKFAVEVRRDSAISGKLMYNYAFGVESNSDISNVDLVASGGVAYNIAKNTNVGFTFFTNVDDTTKDLEVYKGIELVQMF